MNMQAIMREAQKMKKDLEQKQKELENSNYIGKSSFVEVEINGNKIVKRVKINTSEDIKLDEIEMLEDMILLAINDAVKKAENDKEQKLGKLSQGLSGLM